MQSNCMYLQHIIMVHGQAFEKQRLVASRHVEYVM